MLRLASTSLVALAGFGLLSFGWSLIRRRRSEASERNQSPRSEEKQILPEIPERSDAYNVRDEHKVIRTMAVMAPKGSCQAWEYNPRPLGEDEVEITITHCAICHSDLHSIDSGWGMTMYPLVPGHEIIGTIAAKGNNVQLDVGTRVGVGAQCFACYRDVCRECKQGSDNLCNRRIWTYNDKYDDGSTTYGGYADAIRVSSKLVFPIPDAIPSPLAAPLMCAGITVFAPLLNHNVGKGTRICITGLGGLGHLAVQFARALGADVTVLSHSANKEEEAKQLGAHSFIVATNNKQINAATRSFDVVLATAVYSGMNWNQLLTLARPKGKVIACALPEEDIRIGVFSLMFDITLVGSSIGSSEQIREMLEFCVRHNIRPWIQKLPMAQVNRGLDLVRSGQVRYRVVLEN